MRCYAYGVLGHISFPRVGLVFLDLVAGRSQAFPYGIPPRHVPLLMVLLLRDPQDDRPGWSCAWSQRDRCCEPPGQHLAEINL